jgi:hypothetical protein
MTMQTESPATTASGRIHGRAGIGHAIQALAAQARHEFWVCAPQLDPGWFNTAALADTLAHLAAGHRLNRIRMLVEDKGQAVRDNERLVALARRFSEFVELRQVGEQDHGLRELVVIADHEGSLVQLDVTRHDAIVETQARRAAGPLRQQFQERWDRSEPIFEIHTTGL